MKKLVEWMIYLSLAPVVLILLVLDGIASLLGTIEDWSDR